MSYTRRQLVVLLVVLGAAGLGVGVGQWRRAHPDLVERLERFDLDERPATADAPGRRPTPKLRPAPRDAAVTSPSADAPAAPRPAGDSEPLAPLDLNQATVTELLRLPGVGPALAARIVAARDAGGPFTSVDDLRRVRGLGRSKLERFRALVTVVD
jgi:competence ComEA-like helix-hairpin-helix protein